MRRWICCVLLAGFSALSAAQEEEVIRAAMYLCGATSEEEIPEGWVNELEGARRVRINDPRLRPGLLLSAYQVAAIQDYRKSAGDIRSFEELALVDGFGRAAVDALRPFLILDTGRAADTSGVQGTVLLRHASLTFGAKARLGWRRLRLGGAWRGQDGGFYGEYTLRRSRLVVGDYKLRYGQGLLLWDGFSMTSLSTVDAFMQRATGLSPVWSFSPQGVRRGGAFEFVSGPWQAVAFAALGGSYGAHGGWLGRWGQLGASVLWQDSHPAVALDALVNHRGLSVAWEGAWKPGALAAKATLRTRLGESADLTAQVRAVPSRFSGKKHGEYALAAGLSWSSGRWVPLQGKSGFGSSVVAHQLSLTADTSLLPVPGEDSRRLQLRLYGTWRSQLSPLWALEVRLTERYRNYEPSRTALRSDLRLGAGPWQSVLRLEGVHCGAWGFLGYLEGGYKGETLSAYLRLTGFSVSDWAARIYCYERDAPGTFSVPAYSGRGMAASAYGGWKHRFPRWFTLKLYLRAAFTWRPGRDFTPALRLQLQLER